MKVDDRSKSLFFVIGAVLILISFIICVMSFWMLIYGIPVFAFGCILVAFSDRKFNVKLLTCVVPLVLYVPSTIAFLYLYNMHLSDVRLVLIPPGFEGDICVVYEEPCGLRYSEYEDKDALIIPNDGILILNEKFDGNTNFEFAMGNDFGSMQRIKMVEGNTNTSTDSPLVYEAMQGASCAESRSDGARALDKYTMSLFHVYRNGSEYKADSAFDIRPDSLLKKRLLECRDSYH